MIVAQKPTLVNNQPEAKIEEPFTKEGALSSLNNYGTLLSKEMLEYLKCLVQLDANVVKCGDSDRRLLEYLESVLTTTIVSDNTSHKEKVSVAQLNNLIKQIIKYNLFECVNKTLGNVGFETTESYSGDSRHMIFHNGIIIFDSTFANKINPNRENIFTIHQIELALERRNQKIDKLIKERQQQKNSKNTYADDIHVGWPEQRAFAKQLYEMSEAGKEKRIEYLSRKIERLQALESQLSPKQIDFQKKAEEVLRAFDKEYGPFDLNGEETIQENSDTKEKILKRTPFVTIKQSTLLY